LNERNFDRGRVQRNTISATGFSLLQGSAMQTHWNSCVEELEQRRLMTVTISGWSSTTISDLTDYDIFAEARFGDNGYYWGTGENGLGTPSGENDVSMVQWDADESDGVDSSTVSVRLTVTTGSTGTADWIVGQSETTEATPSDMGYIRRVTIRADVASGQMACTWGNLVVYFYHGTSVIDAAAGTVIANTLSSNTTDAKEAGVVLTTSKLNCDKVVITGNVRLQANQGTYPGANDIFGDILISDHT
jgi:hypothetical protein